jgi:predicted DNA-binding protein (UPF0251 family)
MGISTFQWRCIMNDSREQQTILGPAARSVALPNASLRPAAHQLTRFEKANPNEPAGSRAISDAAILAEMLSMTREDFPSKKPRTVAPRGASQRPAALQISPVGRANPTALSPIALSTRQLAATRLVMQGLSSSEVARRIGTIRQTINRWKRLPAFAGEVRRLHEMLAGA